MAGGISIRTTGIESTIKRIRLMPNAVAKSVDAEMDAAARDFENKAVEDAPTDVGGLRQGIKSKRIGMMSYEVVSAAPYAAYIEFGTKNRAQIPSDLQGVASQFKGKGRGDYQAFLAAILDWVKRKGIVSRYSVKTKREIKNYTKDDNDRLMDAAQAIARSIMRHGIHPHPYFFKQRQPVFTALVQKLEPAIKKTI